MVAASQPHISDVRTFEFPQVSSRNGRFGVLEVAKTVRVNDPDGSTQTIILNNIYYLKIIANKLSQIGIFLN